jgi:hypothetical protein
VTFKRYVVVTNANDLSGSASNNVKNIDVVVSWTDSSGTHESKVSTVLTKI